VFRFSVFPDAVFDREQPAQLLFSRLAAPIGQAVNEFALALAKARIVLEAKVAHGAPVTRVDIVVGVSVVKVVVVWGRL